MVDANGAYTRTQALAMAEAFAESGVTWFEEPVSSDDLEGLRMLRERAPPEWRSRRGSTGTTSLTSAACSKRARWMCFRPT
jgi:hypothetical protein